MLTEQQIELIQYTWTQVLPIQDVAADIFYSKLFSLDESLRELFPEEMEAQKKKLMTTINVAVNGLNDLNRLVPILQKLGVRHVDYKVTKEHYPTVGTALLHTLARGLGELYTEEVAEAWTSLYGVITQVMTGAMLEHQNKILVS